MQENENEQTGGATGYVTDEGARKEAEAQAETQVAKEERAAAGMEEGMASGQRVAPETSFRYFLSPQHPNTKFLVKEGKVVSFRTADSPTGKRDASREGDVFAAFVGGVLATQDPDVIEWCKAHGPDEDLHRDYHRARDESTRRCRAGHGVCCDAKDPGANVWVEMKAAQMPTASREATMAPGMDIDRILQGKAPSGLRIGGEGDRLMDAARATEKAQEAVKEED